MASAISLNQIKTNIKALFDANLSDLSTGLPATVAKVLKINPQNIPMQPSFFPAICIFTDSKDIELTDIAVNQDMGKRRGDIEMKIVGLIWNDNYNTDSDDPADDEIETLMENIEVVLREGDTTFSGLVLWSFPTNVTYFSFPTSEQSHMRAGVMTLSLKAHY